MTAWIAGYQGVQPDVTVQYDSVGSGAGRENLLAGAVDFAGSDAALNEEERAKVTEVCGPDGAMNIPVYISPVAVPYNVEGASDQLNQRAATLAADLRPEHLRTGTTRRSLRTTRAPRSRDWKITAVNRSDESGTTENFMEQPQRGSTRRVDLRGRQGQLVSGRRGRCADHRCHRRRRGSTNGAIGYADASAAGILDSAKIGVGEEFVAFSPEAAAKVVDASEPSASDVNGYLALDLARDTDEFGAYPIVLVSYHIACHNDADQEQSADLVKDFVGYVVSEEGQSAASEAAGSAPISADLRTKAEASLDLVQVEN